MLRLTKKFISWWHLAVNSLINSYSFRPETSLPVTIYKIILCSFCAHTRLSKHIYILADSPSRWSLCKICLRTYMKKMKAKDISGGGWHDYFFRDCGTPITLTSAALAISVYLGLRHQGGRKKGRRSHGWLYMRKSVSGNGIVCGCDLSTASFSYVSARQRSFPWDKQLARTEIMWESNKEKSNEDRPGVHTMHVCVCSR